ncbi:zinc finger C2HC domain-containing protein 1C [Podarcis raffonei]|uniref:zinc finger C2HC domain-containing protein 1C n=1 Tax=Podarcis raffonei TaxID=65483 RepID=UPI0023290941|nr:zinc finger C2HC domain-containing protein 1C [Podarcis raffonei]XP_053235180.1 zinc finger C2HC domain-containing protein 1C [Podarcis raffonei]XP_053235187.1 zinc finger C2HC domain-containing protein 1C [Podarcis raffonei]XP_053235197.1 zinc finger C2HC domain-containing protein 1C [Podarcis raffonei]
MAHLQLAVCSHMDPMAANSSLPATSQERCHPEALKEPVQLEHLRSNIQQQFLCNKDKKLADLHIQKGRSSSCSQPAETSQLILEKAGFYSAGPRNWYFKGQANSLPSHWRTKRREGVDRSYPLKPVFPHTAGNVHLPSSWQVGSPPARKTPPISPSSEKKGRSHAVKTHHVRGPSPFSVEQSKRAVSHSRRAESGYIQKLEAAGRSLEEEIQRKEALLREKLRRTEEELRRIQWERQQAEAEGRRQRGGLCMPERKTAGITQGHVSRSIAQMRDCQKVHIPDSPAVSVGTTLPPQALHMEKLKKQRLVASNSKIRENVSQISATSSPELASMRDQAPSAAASLGQVDCVAAEPSYTEAPSSVEDWGECNFCGRKLYCSRLEKHISICRKNHGSKRKVFDSSKARAKGTELETYYLLKGTDTSQRKNSRQNFEASKQNSEISKQSNWRQKHESFIKTLRRARELQRVISKGGKASDLPPAPAMENPDYKLCPYCTRQFAPKVAERHIPKCKNIKNRPPPPQQKKR